MPPQLSREQALEITELLITEYSKGDFQRGLREAWEAAGGNKVEQIKVRQALCLPVQRPIMERFGFEGSPRGVTQCLYAFQSFNGDPDLDSRAMLLQWLVDPDWQSREGSPGSQWKPKEDRATVAKAPELTKDDALVILDSLIWEYSQPDVQAQLCEAWAPVAQQRDKSVRDQVFQDTGLPAALGIMDKYGFQPSMQGFVQLLDGIRAHSGSPIVASKLSGLNWLIAPNTQTDDAPGRSGVTLGAESESESKAEVQVPPSHRAPPVPRAPKPPTMTREEVAEMEDMLVTAYSRPEFQSELHTAWDAAGNDVISRTKARQRACLPFQIPILEKYGFEPSVRGVARTAYVAARHPGPELEARYRLLAWLVDPELQASKPAPSLDEQRLKSGRVSAWESSPGIGRHAACATVTCKFAASVGKPYCCLACPSVGRGVLASQSASEDDTSCDQDGHHRFCSRLTAFTLWSSWWESCHVDRSFPEDCQCLVVPPAGFTCNSGPLPVILFLSGVGHVDGRESFFEGGVNLLLRNPVVRRECIVVAPLPTTRCGVVRLNSRGKLAWREDVVWLVFTEILRRLTPERADLARLYATGFSLGATGIWRILSKYGRHFAAVCSICGYAEWPGDTWPQGSGPSSNVLDILSCLPIRAYEIDMDKGGDSQASPGWDMEWLNWGREQRHQRLTLRGMDPDTQLDVNVREWPASDEPARHMELWTVKGPLHDSAMMSQFWGGDDHCLWYRVFPFVQWDLAGFFLRHTCLEARQWKVTEQPVVLDVAQANVDDWEDWFLWKSQT